MARNQVTLRRLLRSILVGSLLGWLGLGPFGAAAETLTFAIIGDYGMDNSAEAGVANLVKGWSPELIIAVGDDYYSAAGGTGDTRYDESTGGYFCAFLKDITTSGSRCPAPGAATGTNRFFPVLGNHDYSDTGNGGALPSAYTNYFNLPGSGVATGRVPSGNERYYDFIWGSVHFFMLNSGNQVTGNHCTAAEEPDGCDSGSVQASWLRAALAASTAPWKVVVLHKVPFSSDVIHGGTPFMQWPYEAWGANLVVGGHSHTYERIVRDENGDGTPIPYIVNGIGGASRHRFTTPVAGSEFRYNGNSGAMRVIASDTETTLEFFSIDDSTTPKDRYHLPVRTCTPG